MTERGWSVVKGAWGGSSCFGDRSEVERRQHWWCLGMGGAGAEVVTTGGNT